MLKEVTIYTDGACSKNPGPGGYGAILMYKQNKIEISGREDNTTNNKMEMMAAIVALEKLKEPCKVTLYSDSAYLVNAINQGWLNKWKINNWKTTSKEPVKNIDLWTRLDKLLNMHEVKFIKVKGHADNEFNNRCDTLATSAIISKL